MKKISILLLTALALMLTAACAEDMPAPVLAWETDPANHWQLAEDGEVINCGAHQLTDGWLCSVCNSGVQVYEDGTADVIDHDGYDDEVRFTSYDENGGIVHQSFHVLTRDENGVILHDQYYVNHVIAYDALYFVNENGEQIPVTETSWLEDGSWSVVEYDAFGNLVLAVSYAADGTKDVEIITTYAAMEDEWDGLVYYERTRLERCATGESYYSETNERGDTLRTLNTLADGTVSEDYEYQIEYNGELWRWRGTYTQGRLVFEETYTEDGSLDEEIEHFEDGSKTVTCFDFNEYPMTATTYAADGTVLSRTVYEVVRSEEGDLLAIRVVTDGLVAEETQYLYVTDEEGWTSFAGLVKTVYHADGTYTVTKHDYLAFNSTSTLYAADGTVIMELLQDDEDFIIDEE